MASQRGHRRLSVTALAVSHSQALVHQGNLNHLNILEETTWDGVDSSGGSQITPVTISLRECLKGQPGVMLNLTCCSQMRTTMVTVVMDNRFKLSCHQEEGWRLGSSIRTLAFRRAGFSLCRELLCRMPWEGTMSRKATKQSWCGILGVNHPVMQKDWEF